MRNIVLAFVVAVLIPFARAESNALDVAERMRALASDDISDIRLDFAGPHLRVWGHARQNFSVVRLMRDISRDVSPDVNLIYLANWKFEGQEGVAFRLTVLNVGKPDDWAAPMTLRFQVPSPRLPRYVNPTDASKVVLGSYPLSELSYIGVLTNGRLKSGVVRSSDGTTYRAYIRDYVGRERGMVVDITDKVLFLLDETGVQQELEVANPTSNPAVQGALRDIAAQRPRP